MSQSAVLGQPPGSTCRRGRCWGPWDALSSAATLSDLGPVVGAPLTAVIWGHRPGIGGSGLGVEYLSPHPQRCTPEVESP